ncbi:MAG: hypothetical protein AAF266_03965 [Planctomycetota bacterium]
MEALFQMAADAFTHLVDGITHHYTAEVSWRWLALTVVVMSVAVYLLVKFI